MVQMVCPCLNVRVHGKGNTLELRDACSLNLSDDVLGDNFFSSQVYDVLLDLGGVTKAHKSLCSSRTVDGWVITSCIGCEMDVYAKHLDDNDRVLVSCSIEDPNRITALMESENYSSLFKLLLPELNDNFVQNNFGGDVRSANDSLERAIKNVHQQVSGYLRDEQRAMEERIRAFREQQQARYAALQQKVRRHKQAMLYLLLKKRGSKKSSLTDSLVESVSPSSPVASIFHSGDDSSSSSDSAHPQEDTSADYIMETAIKVRDAPHPGRNLRRMHSVNNPPRRPKQNWALKQVSHSIDVGGMFDMEGFETSENSRPFYNSDDDTDGSSIEDNVPQKQEEQQKQQYSGSLPISVPAWSSHPRYSIYEDEEDKILPHKDPEQLATSFLALVQSVKDGTEIFGDLPRRRLNTGELLKSRPL